MFDCGHKLNQIGIKYHKLEKRKKRKDVQINVWREKEKQSPQAQKAHMATKARKLTLYIVLALYRIKTLRSLNEVTCEACFVSDCMNCSSCRITLDYFSMEP